MLNDFAKIYDAEDESGEEAARQAKALVGTDIVKEVNANSGDGIRQAFDDLIRAIKIYKDKYQSLRPQLEDLFEQTIKITRKNHKDDDDQDLKKPNLSGMVAEQRKSDAKARRPTKKNAKNCKCW